jgi:hypothetical protein
LRQKNIHRIKSAAIGIGGTNMKAKFVQVINVFDPDTGGKVELEVWKDPTSGGIFALDSSFLDQVEDSIVSPFNPSVTLELFLVF